MMECAVTASVGACVMIEHSGAQHADCHRLLQSTCTSNSEMVVSIMALRTMGTNFGVVVFLAKQCDGHHDLRRAWQPKGMRCDAMRCESTGGMIPSPLKSPDSTRLSARLAHRPNLDVCSSSTWNDARKLSTLGVGPFEKATAILKPGACPVTTTSS